MPTLMLAAGLTDRACVVGGRVYRRKRRRILLKHPSVPLPSSLSDVSQRRYIKIVLLFSRLLPARPLHLLRRDGGKKCKNSSAGGPRFHDP